MKRFISCILIISLVLSPAMAFGADKNLKSSGNMSTKVIAYDGEVYTSHTNLTVNVGKSRTVMASFIKDDALDIPAKFACESFTSSNSKVAKVSSSGVVTGVKPGSATITCKSNYSRTPAVIQITVPSKKTAAGSAYIKLAGKFPHKQLLASSKMLQGTQNRLNGTIYSDENMKSLVVKFLGSTGKVGTTYTKAISGKSLALNTLQSEIPFAKLKKGEKGIAVYIKNSLGTVKLFEDKFTVVTAADMAALSATELGRFIALQAVSRGGDPFNSSLRGSKNYVDASYLTWWAYKQAGVKNLPMTAAEQYKYCVDKKMTVSKGSLRPGDLVFHGSSKNNGRYNNIYNCMIYIGHGLAVAASSPSVDFTPIVGPIGTKYYYGRPR